MSTNIPKMHSNWHSKKNNITTVKYDSASIIRDLYNVEKSNQR